MVHQLIGLEAHGQDVIGDPLVEQIVLGGELLVGGEDILIGILMIVEHPFHYLLRHIIGCGVYTLLAPEVVGFCKDGEAILAVLGSQGIGIAVARLVAESLTHVFLQVGDGIGLIQVFVHLVPYGRECIHESASQHTFGKGQVTLTSLFNDVTKVFGTSHIAGSDDLLHLVNHTIDEEYIAVVDVYGAVSVDIDTVGEVDGRVISESLVIEIGQGELGIVLGGEECEGVSLCLHVTAVDDTVLDNHLAYGIQLDAVSKGVP